MTADASMPRRQFEGTVEARHFAEYMRSVTRRMQAAANRAGWRRKIVMTAVYAVATVATVLMLIHFANGALVRRVPGQGIGPAEIAVLSMVAGVLLVTGLGVIVARFQRRLYAGLTLREGGSFLGPRKFALEDEGIAITGPHGHSLTRWSCCQELTDSGDTLLLWTDPGAALIVPKAALGDDTDAAAFKAFVTARIGRGEAAG